MNSYLSRLNPIERRFVIAVGLVFFLVINIFFIWPHFADWGDLRGRLDNSRSTLAKRSTLIAQNPKVETEIKKLASEGSYVPPEDQSLQFLRTIQTQAAQTGVGFIGNSRQTTSTNLFFVEQAQTITVASGEKQLVDFLYSLGSGNSLVRVREIAIRPDPNRQQLNANVTLVASYQKSSKAPAPAARPATQPGTPPPAKPKPANPISRPDAPKAATPNKK
jgi:type II secretory pathway component PulM